jgi:hypothetical protein
MYKPAPKDVCRGHWLAMPLESMLTDRTPRKPPVRVELRVSRHEPPMLLETFKGGVRVRPADGDQADAVIAGPPDAIIGLLVGRMNLAAAQARRLRFDGDPSILKRFEPSGEAG